MTDDTLLALFEADTTLEAAEPILALVARYLSDTRSGDGPVSTKFVPPADLTNPELHKVRTDGYWQSYLSAGGAVMPSYAEALSSDERWHVVNYLRTLAKK